ncbi:MAG: hypothetical protein GY847_33130, partial [Proteobacteria bacterium]|nr:hypothetical protein [Pseudomonadota bacterium]
MASSSPRDVHNLDSALPATQLLMAGYILRKHHRKILAISLLALFAAAAWSLLATPFYRADSRLLVRVGREDVYVSPTPTKAVVDRGPREGYKLNSEMAILQSPRLVIELVDQFGIDRLFEYKNGENARQLPLEKVYEVVGNNLHVSSLPKSNVIGIAFEWPDPAIAAQMVNKLVDL